MRFTLRASAKINLDLRVGARRPDGYHELHTIYQTLDLHDSVTVESRRGPFGLDGDAALMPLDATNLVWRAAVALWRKTGKPGEPRGVRVHVTKRIPAQAGLGGGSSDAAATLIALSRAWRLRLSLGDLMDVAAALGSDVPFFLVGGTALGLGRGEQIYPLVNRPRRHVVLVLPDVGVATADAYRWLADDRAADSGLRTPGSGLRAPDPARGPSMNSGPEAAEGWTLDPGRFRHDLEPSVEQRHPEIAAIRARLEERGAELARMSGSGSAVFGLFSDAHAARRAAGWLARDGHRVSLTRTRPRNLIESQRIR